MVEGSLEMVVVPYILGGGGGGGGAGGSIKLVGNSVTVNANTSAYGAGGGAGVAGNGTGASNGGTGGSGRIAVYYSNSISGTSSPAQQTFTLSYNSYAVYISKEVHTPDATSYGNIGWTESLPSGTEIQLQTRSGATPNSKDGTWEAWKPTTSSLVINDLNTHTDFTGTNVTVADGDITRNIDYHEDEDEFTSGNITKLTATLANGYAETTLSPSVDLSSYTYITAWVRSSFAGNSIKLGFGESAGTEQEKIISVDSINTWQKVYWDISGITGTSRDAVTKFRVTLPTNTTVAYIDSIKAESYLTTPGGSTITSTANDYIQYRAILTTSNTANTPTLSAITVGYTNPSGTYTIDANRVKNLVDVDFYQSNRLTLTEYPLVDYKKLRTLVGPNQVAQNTVNDLGNGSDGARTISTNVNINVSNTPGRSCADGGDAVNYSVTSFPDNTSAVLESASSTGCLSVNDEVLLINLRGTGTQYANVGNYETLRISSISGTTVNFATSKTKYYGNGTSDDTNIGLGVGNQTVMLQRVPNYTDVTVEVGTIFSPDEWVQPTGAVNNGAGEGGVIFFRATGTVSVAGIVSAWARGYAASTTATGYATYAYGGEAFCAGNVAPPGDSGGGAGGNNGTQYAGYTNNKCGGGGGAGYINSTGGAGIAVGGAGGAGGASSSSNYGIGGGGGGGGYGGGGSGGVGALNNGGWNGSTNQSGAGGNSIASTYGYAGGGGGGGTYGDSDLTKLFFGASGGNGGGGMSNTTSYNGGIGGDGGGIVFIAGSTVSVSGYLTSAGSAGTTAAGSGGWGGGGGGGGAGGSIKVVGNSVSLGTASTTSGGSGGAGNMGGGSYAANGGAGGVGRIAVYSATNPTGTTTPTFTSTTIPGYNYGVFVSEEIPTYQATDYGNLAWNFNDNGYGDIQFQTRSGASNNSTDGTWEAWKPVTQGTNYIDLNNMNTVGDWTVTNQSVVADGDATRNIDYSEDEDEGTVGNISKFVSTSANGYAEDTITSTDLSNYDYISAWVYSGTTGNILKLGFGESSATENEETINIDRANTWQKVYWDIRDVDKSLRNAVTKIRMTIIPTSTTIQLDNMKGERLLRNSSGSTITSTVNNYIQYRAVFTTTNESYKPTLYNVQLTWKTGYKLVNTDANTTRLYNYSGQTQDLRINVTTSGGASALGSGWTEVGGNVYRGSGFVGIGDATPDVELKVVGALCVKSNADACAGATAGTIYANNTSVQSADLAEMYEVSDLSIEAGDLVSLDPNAIGEVQKANPDNVASVMGVVSTSPGLLMNDNNKDNSRPIGLIGRLPVKVMTAGRSVEKGDVITASALDGIGVTRNDSGIIVAKALEDTFDWSDASCTTVNTISDIKWPADKGQNESKPCFKVPVDSFEASLRGTLMNTYNLTLSDSIYIGKVMAFVDVVWYQPQWVSDEMASLLSDYSGGRLGGEGSGWTIEGDSLKTDKEVSVNRIEGTSANFGILNGNLLNIGNGSLVSDSGGNLSVGGDLLIAGHLKSESGSLVLEIGSSINDMFVIKNVKGEVVFSVDGTGSVGGKGIYRSEWVRISPNSSLKVHHNFNATPSSINIIKSDNSQGYGFTSKGLGSEYYFEYYDSNTIQVYNKTSGVIYVKLTIEK
ncbi:hypothetical protein HYV12_01360 [Candidatus Dojkabacteria bacterium]|nr:hypothetical protein [Candidatus Dojkabacteria bacterium]